MTERTVAAKDLPDDTRVALVDPDEEVSEAELEETETLNNLLADLGELDSVKVTIYRVDSNNKTSWVDSFSPSDMDIDALMHGLRNDYGGGKFRIQIREKGTIRKNKTIEIEPPIKKTEPDTRSLFADLKKEQATESSGMASILSEIIRANNESAARQAEQMSNFMGTMVTAMSTMGNNQTPAPVFDPVAAQHSMMETVVALKKLSDPPAPIDTTALILKGVELVNAVKGGDESGEANIYSVLSKALGSFGGTLSQAMAATPTPLAPPNQPPTIAAPGSTIPQPVKPQVQALTKEPAPLPDDHPMKPFEPYIDWMLTLAKKNANPELYAEVIVDTIGLEMAHAWLATSEGVETLTRELPRTLPFVSWFVAVGQIVDEIKQEAENPPPGNLAKDGDVVSDGRATEPITIDQPSIDRDTERPAGDSGDVTDNVATSEPGKNDGSDT